MKPRASVDETRSIMWPGLTYGLAIHAFFFSTVTAMRTAWIVAVISREVLEANARKKVMQRVQRTRRRRLGCALGSNRDSDKTLLCDLSVLNVLCAELNGSRNVTSGQQSDVNYRPPLK
jgi:hypothetical protein